MSNIDWADLNRKGTIEVLMLPPANLNDSYGVLEGVDLANSTITEAYYTDSRISASLRYVGAGWIRQSALQIKYKIPEWHYETVLGTFFVDDDPSFKQNGMWFTDLNLSSALHVMGLHSTGKQHWLPAGSYAKSAMYDVCNAAHRELIDKNANDHRFSEPYAFASDEYSLSRMFYLAGVSNNRLGVDPYGRITVEPYVIPSLRVPTFEIDLRDDRGIAHDDLSRSSSYLQMPTECHVIYRFSETVGQETYDYEISGSAIADGHTSFGARGYIVSDVSIVDELYPATKATAERLARENLAKSLTENSKWELTTEYLPIHQGDVGWLRGVTDPFGFSGDKLVMVSDITMRLSNMQMQLMLKETSSADIWEDDVE